MTRPPKPEPTIAELLGSVSVSEARLKRRRDARKEAKSAAMKRRAHRRALDEGAMDDLTRRLTVRGKSE
jgi:hypothetical protein